MVESALLVPEITGKRVLGCGVLMDWGTSFPGFEQGSEMVRLTNSMQHQGKPPSSAERETQTIANLDGIAVGESGVDGDEAATGAVDVHALGEVALELGPVVILEGDLVAVHGAVDVLGPAEDEGADDHDDAERDDGGGVEPGADHPGAVLVDLQALDVVVGHAGAEGGEDGEHAREDLGFEAAAEGVAGDHQGADVGEEKEGDDEVAVDAVEYQGFVADDGDELLVGGQGGMG